MLKRGPTSGAAEGTFERQVERLFAAAAVARTRAARSSSSTSPAHVRLATGEKSVEEIGEGIFVAKKVAHFLGRHRPICALTAAWGTAEMRVPLTRIEAGASASLLRLLVHLPVRSQLVVLLPLVRIAHDFVRFVDFFELRLG